jgi:hypothetical protein
MYTQAFGSHEEVPPVLLPLLLVEPPLVPLLLLPPPLFAPLLVPPPLDVQLVNCQRAGTALGVQPSRLVCA